MESVRSEWERDIERYIRNNYSSLLIQTNNRTKIPSRESNGQYLEIDIWLPELLLGIEANGTHWHDRTAYDADKRNGTEYSEEMYKENYCKRHGIKLIHVWDAESVSAIHNKIDSAIQSCRSSLNNSTPVKIDSAIYSKKTDWGKIGIGAFIAFIALISLYTCSDMAQTNARYEDQQRAIAQRNEEIRQEDAKARQQREANRAESQRLYDQSVALSEEAVRLYNEGREEEALEKERQSNMLFDRAISLQ